MRVRWSLSVVRVAFGSKRARRVRPSAPQLHRNSRLAKAQKKKPAYKVVGMNNSWIEGGESAAV